MTARRPTRWYIVGEKVLSEVRDNAPDDVKEIFANITRSLEQGPYPGNNMLHAVETRGFAYPNSFITWHDDVMVLYQVMRDQPVVSLIGVLWPRARRSSTPAPDNA